VNDIKALRDQLDGIDDKLVSLYAERMALSEEIGRQKAGEGKPVYNPERENEILARLVSSREESLALPLKQLYGAIFDTSRAVQGKYMRYNAGFTDGIRAAVSARKAFPAAATVACQGVYGSHAGSAAAKLFGVPSVTYFKTFDGVFSAVERGLCRFGVLPIENSTAGSVNAVYDLIQEHDFYIVRSIKLEIRHSLMANRGVKLADITEVFSHEQALSQCGEFLKTLKNVKLTVCANTAEAAKYVAESGRTDAAAVSAYECAEIYGLNPLMADVQFSGGNYTRFICIAKNLEIYKNAGKISILTALSHSPGSLYRLLSKFSALGLNLTKLESRPMKNSNFEFLFYFDFEADIEDAGVLSLIGELYALSPMFVFLGAYSEV
jgi:chorismate mutase/prephenate dehydratase